MVEEVTTSQAESDCVTARRTKKLCCIDDGKSLSVSITDRMDEPASIWTRSNGEAEVNPYQLDADNLLE